MWLIDGDRLEADLRNEGTIMKCKICGKEIKKGKYCILCEMKSKILFKGF